MTPRIANKCKLEPPAHLQNHTLAGMGRSRTVSKADRRFEKAVAAVDRHGASRRKAATIAKKGEGARWF
ncbi:unnamed protein product [Chondrus crispus]|uniref:Uncharacterized protein n=1 Tax=Chondrus crispus TaxID=2769 RepID=R7Q7E2_CHOCR|nr:unnamed protein product [Chondrus crispus]XP_005712823.1 unnamed protein product [Chondrus crispus]XP_005714261.1 unnamed protein product [Chondrus crispus]CDF33020.1 unnamed protein product [Chondrus crispus]CDF34442.1 unnamed protein product [Chondrus crispus]CDF40062.1 unnamed protein product [Chondrus crispus]|eukprot:XP_005710356.1 unnamed protein product [Chondrus crispus]